MDNQNKEKTALEKVAEALKHFWFRRSPSAVVRKTPHTQIFVEPKIFIGSKLNPEISNLLVKEYLASLSLQQVLDNQVLVAPQSVIIRDKSGKPILDIKNKNIIAAMHNNVIQAMGQELAGLPRKQGDPFIEPKPSYCFADIADALVSFMREQNKMDSKNLFRDACLLLLGPDRQRATLERPDSQSS